MFKTKREARLNLNVNYVKLRASRFVLNINYYCCPVKLF